MGRRIRRGLPALALLALAGCQSLPPPVPEQAPARQSISVPFHPQERYQCGPASLAMVLGWAGKPASAEALVDEVWLPERRGSLLIELEAAARARGLLVVPVNTPAELFRELDAGHPVLVMQNLGLSFWPQWHFAVAKGYRDNGQRVLLHSGTEANRDSHWNRFVRTWARARYRGFVVLPAGSLPATAAGTELVRSLEDLRAVAGADAALPHWRTAVSRYPRDYLLRFGYGNLLWSLDRPGDAAAAFATATRLQPDSAAAWNNLAEARLHEGCTEAALAAARKAATLAPDNDAVRDTLRKVEAAQGEPSSSCGADSSPAGVAPGESASSG